MSNELSRIVVDLRAQMARLEAELATAVEADVARIRGAVAELRALIAKLESGHGP